MNQILGMFYIVYLLRSKKDNGFYIGYTSRLEIRVEQHNSGKVESTRYRRPLELVYFESYKDEFLAKERERKLKQFGSSFNGLLKRLNYR